MFVRVVFSPTFDFQIFVPPKDMVTIDQIYHKTTIKQLQQISSDKVIKPRFYFLVINPLSLLVFKILNMLFWWPQYGSWPEKASCCKWPVLLYVTWKQPFPLHDNHSLSCMFWWAKTFFLCLADQLVGIRATHVQRYRGQVYGGRTYCRLPSWIFQTVEELHWKHWYEVSVIPINLVWKIFECNVIKIIQSLWTACSGGTMNSRRSIPFKCGDKRFYLESSR